MNRTLLFLLTAVSLHAGAQSGPDSTLVDKNFQRLGELKSKLQRVGKSIDEQEEREVSNYELFQLLQGMDQKISQIASRQDSLIRAMQKSQAEEDAAAERKIKDDRYYMVIESHLTPERAAKALDKHEGSFEEVVAISQADTGRWYYLILGDGVLREEIQSELLALRKKIPTAWYISGGKLKD